MNTRTHPPAIPATPAAGRPGRGGSWLRLSLGVLFTAMALGQLVSLPAMPQILATYGLHPRSVTLAVALALIAGGLLAGVWLWARPRSRAVTPVALYTAVTVAWTALAAWALARGASVPNCGCFGRYLPQHLSWFTLAEDALLLVYAVLLARGVRFSGERDGTRGAVSGR
ncbi:MauE/DoxX family redox-associated membrane protein [Streptomyces sp. NPDC048385]|uniref:MauE/DoxX family redox-associated membrane protein n=1 Tax=unclassified Streptomyces TaxID=2593676 RepID=UPI00341D6BB2